MEKELLKEVYNLLIDNNVVQGNAVYVPPAQRLRDEADAIERKEKVIAEFKDYINKLTP